MGGFKMDEEAERRFQELQDKYAGVYQKINTEICLEDELGMNVVQSLLKKELNRVDCLAQNASTITIYIDSWIKNFKENLIRGYIPDNPRYFGDSVRIKDSAIVVGAGPSLTDEQIEMLQYYKGTIICCNKSLERLLEHGVFPTIVPAIHSTEEIALHFDNDAVVESGSMCKYLLCTHIHPKVPEALFTKVGCSEKQVFWFHGAMAEELVPNFNTMFTSFVNLPTIDTGGNVGLMGVQVAQYCGAKTIGMLGMEHCVPLDPEWTNEDAQEYNIVYAPEDNLHFALTPVMRSYLQVLNTWYMVNRNEFTIRNLTPNGLFYVRRNMRNKSIPYMGLDDFIRGYE
jgi:hypothetical protein